MDTTEHISITEFRERCGRLLDQVHYQDACIAVEKRGEAYAYVISTGEMEHLRRMQDLFDAITTEAAMAEEGRDMSADDLRRDLGL